MRWGAGGPATHRRKRATALGNTGLDGFGADHGGNPRGVTPTTTSQQELFRFLEDRFACAQACTECARACALRASLVDPDGTEYQELVRRKGIMCAEVCDATCRVLSEQNQVDETAIRVQLEWCMQVCLEGAHVFDKQPGAEDSAEACRACARACGEFLATLR
ncbi:ferredoxin [Streptomyces sp. HO565]